MMKINIWQQVFYTSNSYSVFFDINLRLEQNLKKSKVILKPQPQPQQQPPPTTFLYEGKNDDDN